MTAMGMKSSDARKSFDIWKGISWGILALYALFLIYPLIRLLISAVYVVGHFTLEYFGQFFAKKYYTSTIWRFSESQLHGYAGFAGDRSSVAYFYTMYDLKGKRVLQSSDHPLQHVGSVHRCVFLDSIAWKKRSDHRMVQVDRDHAADDLRLPGQSSSCRHCNCSLVFLYVCGGLKNVDQSLLEASENLGCMGVKRFFTVVINLCLPTMLASALLMVFMRAFADFGTPMMIGEGYRTFPVEIYQQYLGEVGQNHNFAAAISTIAILITAAIFFLQKWATSRFKFTINALHPIQKKKPEGMKSRDVPVLLSAGGSVATLPNLFMCLPGVPQS